MGLGHTSQFQRYHRVLNRAVWSSREASRVLLRLLVETFVPDGPLILGLDETLERRWGRKIATKGIYRDPVRSSHGCFVNVSGLRWVCMMLLVPLPWAARMWVLPFLSVVLAPSERYNQECGKTHKSLTKWTRQMILLVRRWWPNRQLVVVADGAYARLRLLACCRSLPNPVTFITRLRLDAAL